MTPTVKTLAPAVLAIAAFASTLACAEARGLRLRGISRVARAEAAVPSTRPAVVAVPRLASAETSAPNPATTGAVDRNPEAATEQPRLVDDAAPRSARPAPPPEPARVTRVAEPWCRSGRVAGSGAGFCLIN